MGEVQMTVPSGILAVETARHTRRAALKKAIANIEHRERMSAQLRAEIEARLAGVPECDLCDEEGFVVDKNGKLVIDDGDEVACYHGKAVDLD